MRFGGGNAVLLHSLDAHHINIDIYRERGSAGIFFLHLLCFVGGPGWFQQRQSASVGARVQPGHCA